MAFPDFDMEELSDSGLAWLFLTFGYVLFQGSSLISEGSDLLLLVPAYAGLVGSCVLPVLGAVPDGAIMLFSGMGDISEAQEQLAVGVGALAGSTIMLLTIPWALATIAGRVDIENGECNYKNKPKLSSEKALSLFQCGVAPSNQVRTGAIAMMLTSISYFIIQGPCIKLESGSMHMTGEELAQGEKWFALLGLCTSVFGFVAYLTYQVATAGTDQDTRKFKADEIIKQKLRKGQVTIAGAMSEIVAKEVIGRKSDYAAVASPKATDRNSEAYARLSEIVRPFFRMFDTDNNGDIDETEAKQLLQHLGEKVSAARVASFFQEMDKNNDHHIDFDEFVSGLAIYLESALESAKEDDTSPNAEEEEEDSQEKSNEDEIEEDDIPEDISHLSPAQQQTVIKRRALFKLMLGTALVLVFSDPMVDVMSEIGTRLNISGFYVSFVLAPLASNASELISAFNFALRKTPKTITISYSSLEGAACMNNTFALSIFFMLIFFRGLAWAYTAETIAILVVQILMAFMAFKRIQTLADAALVFSFYPLSIALVALLEAAGLD